MVCSTAAELGLALAACGETACLLQAQAAACSCHVDQPPKVTASICCSGAARMLPAATRGQLYLEKAGPSCSIRLLTSTINLLSAPGRNAVHIMSRPARLALPAAGTVCREEHPAAEAVRSCRAIWPAFTVPQCHGLFMISLNTWAAGLLDLRCLQLARNAVTSRLELRTLAALPQLQDLTLAGNPVVAGMPERQRRILLWHMLPGQCPAALQSLTGCRDLCSDAGLSCQVKCTGNAVAHMLSWHPEAL